MSEYRKETRYHFRLDGYAFSVSDVASLAGVSVIDIEESRKNGQEDTHMSGELCMNPEGDWEWDEHSAYQSFDRYGYEGLSDSLCRFLNTYTHPEFE